MTLIKIIFLFGIGPCLIVWGIYSFFKKEMNKR